MLNDFLKAHNLTAREIEIVSFVIQGMSNKEVGNTLMITEKTVKFHLSYVYKKMLVTSRAQLIVKCLPYMKVG